MEDEIDIYLINGTYYNLAIPKNARLIADSLEAQLASNKEYIAVLQDRNSKDCDIIERLEAKIKEITLELLDWKDGRESYE